MKKAFVLCILLYSSLSAQPRLDIKPGNIEFEDIFHRLENVYFINDGDELLRIDSVIYSQNYYFMRFGYNYQTPFFIEPDDSILMDCVLAGYLYVPVADTSDTVYVYSNSDHGVEDLRIKIDFFDSEYYESEIYGTITDNGTPVPDANVYFFHEGSYLVDSTRTDAAGTYSINLYPGNYLVAAEKVPYYLTFYGNTPDPFIAQMINLPKYSTVQADIQIIPSTPSPFSVSGKITDSLTNVTLKKALVIARKGTHTPGKKSDLNLQGEIYAAIANNTGNYKISNIISPDFYLVQSFSNYYVPGYYTLPNTTAVFWQNADTVLINSGIINIDIGMLRDSSFGGGIVNGNITTSDGSPVSDVLVYAQPVNSSNLYTYTPGRESGTFKLNYLPYGTYNLIGQKAGLENAYAGPVIIDSLNTDTSGINLVFSLLSGDEPLNPANFILQQNYPNPFNPETNFEIVIPEESNIEFTIYNIIGELVATLYKGNLSRGIYSFRFDGRNLSSGTYLAILKAGNILQSKKILLLK